MRIVWKLIKYYLTEDYLVSKDLKQNVLVSNNSYIISLDAKFSGTFKLYSAYLLSACFVSYGWYIINYQVASSVLIISGLMKVLYCFGGVYNMKVFKWFCQFFIERNMCYKGLEIFKRIIHISIHKC